MTDLRPTRYKTHMERMRRLADIWNWLPAFRAVAETEHLPTASEKLHVSPSALSRTIRLLEEGVGSPLFDRVGRELKLNANGAILLNAVRDAMRIVDEGVATIDNAQFAGPVHVGAVGVVASTFVLPALARLAKKHQKLVPHVYNVGGKMGHPKLLRGELDIVIHDDKAATPEVITEPIGAIEKGVYCGRPHPLYGMDDTTLEECLQHSFAAPTLTRSGTTPDGWPPHVQRDIGVHLSELHLGIDVCVRGAHLAVLPHVLVGPDVAAGDLFRLPVDVVASATIYASRRKSVGPEGRAEAVLRAIQSEFEINGAGAPPPADTPA